MIIMGYPGVGKTTLAKGDYRFIDLDSSNPLLCGTFRTKKWEDRYVDTALYLSQKGYHVFVSTHPGVVKRAISRDANHAILVYPNPALKKEWVNKLYKRYESIRNRPTHNAWLRAKEDFDEDIESFEKVRCHQIELISMDYDLKKDLIHVITGLQGGGI